MADNSSKLWLQKTQNEQAISRALQAIEQSGRALPCRVVAVNGSIVTVAFEVDASPSSLPQVTIPKGESPWIRMPTQVGDFGVTMPADTHLGGVSGLGGGVPKLAKDGTLSALVFVPISNKNSPPIDQNAAQISGPNGAIIQTQDGTAKIVVNKSGITLTFGSISIVLDSAGIHQHGAVTGDNTATYSGEGTFNGHTVTQHTHPVSGVAAGSATVTSQKPTG